MTSPDASLRNKMDDVNATGADLVCTANPGCMVQLDAGLRLYSAPPADDADGEPPRSLHAIQLLDASYALAEGDAYADVER